MAKDDGLRELAEQARQALAEEQELLAVKLGSSMWKAVPNGAIHPWTKALSVIEANGWVLDQWSVAMDGSSSPHAFPVFRRRDSAATTTSSTPAAAHIDELSAEPAHPPQSR